MEFACNNVREYIKEAGMVAGSEMENIAYFLAALMFLFCIVLSASAGWL